MAAPPLLLHRGYLLDALALVAGFVLTELALKPKNKRLSTNDLLKAALIVGGIKYVSDFGAKYVFDTFW